MNSGIITCKDEISYIVSVVSCPSECSSCPPFLCLSLPVCLSGLRCPLLPTTSSLLILALLVQVIAIQCSSVGTPSITLACTTRGSVWFWNGTGRLEAGGWRSCGDTGCVLGGRSVSLTFWPLEVHRQHSSARNRSPYLCKTQGRPRW